MLSFQSPCRLAGRSPGPAAGDQQVAAELEVERVERRDPIAPRFDRARAARRSAARRPRLRPAGRAAARRAGRAADGRRRARRAGARTAWRPRPRDRVDVARIAALAAARSLPLKLVPRPRRSSPRWRRSTRMRSGNVSCVPPSGDDLRRGRETRGPCRRRAGRSRSRRSLPAISVRASCCRSIHAPNVSAPGRSTVSRTTMTWSGWLAKTSRV